MNICDELYNYILSIKKENLCEEYIKLSVKHDLQIVKYIFLEIHEYTMECNMYKEQLIRVHQNRFRDDLIKLYNGCIITKVNKFQACHIIPFSDSDFVNKYDKYNGILLKSDLHELFDDYIFSINPTTYKIEFNEDFFKDEFNKEEYSRFDGITLILPINEKLKSNLMTHYKIFIVKKIEKKV
jgi:hypothetical protein